MRINYENLPLLGIIIGAPVTGAVVGFREHDVFAGVGTMVGLQILILALSAIFVSRQKV
jgi:hypothetical protein